MTALLVVPFAITAAALVSSTTMSALRGQEHINTTHKLRRLQARAVSNLNRMLLGNWPCVHGAELTEQLTRHRSYCLSNCVADIASGRCMQDYVHEDAALAHTITRTAVDLSQPQKQHTAALLLQLHHRSAKP